MEASASASARAPAGRDDGVPAAHAGTWRLCPPAPAPGDSGGHSSAASPGPAPAPRSLPFAPRPQPRPQACSWFAAGTLLHTWWPRAATKQTNGEKRSTSRLAIASVAPVARLRAGSARPPPTRLPRVKSRWRWRPRLARCCPCCPDSHGITPGFPPLAQGLRGRPRSPEEKALRGGRRGSSWGLPSGNW